MNQLQLELYAQLPSEDVSRLVTFGIGADDLLYVVLDPDWVYGPELQPVSHQPIEDDRILLVGARCYWLGDRPDENARIYRCDGTLERSFTLGDGIAGLAVTPDGLIWTSYWDEGAYGNLGWGQRGMGRADGPPPLGSRGLVAWRPNGSKAYEYVPPTPESWIDDCYVMTSVGNDVWIDYIGGDSDGWTIVHVRSFNVVGRWDIPVDTPHGLAVYGDHAVVEGGVGSSELEYSDWRRGYSLAFVPPGGGDGQLLNTFHLSDRTRVQIDGALLSRGDALFLIRDRDVFRFTVEEAMEASQRWQ